MSKLGIRPGARVYCTHIPGNIFLGELEKSGAVLFSRPAKDLDFILFGAENSEDLARLSVFLKHLAPSGAIWTVFPKGRKDFRESEVMAASRAAGLVDVKVASFSQTHTALKMMVRKA